MEPDNRIWYAVWNMELKNVPGTIVGDFCFKGLGKDGVVEIGYGSTCGHMVMIPRRVVEKGFRGFVEE